MALLELVDVAKSYRSPDGAVRCVLDVPSFRIEAGEQLAIAGESGSGKTTLLNVIAGLVKPDTGVVRFDGTDLATLSEGRRDAFRARHMGFVFQAFHLLEGYTALENVVLGMTFGPGPDRERASSLLKELGLAEHLDHRPSQLSAGQKQRVALARALANAPRLVLADEPTGNLDPKSADEALELIRETCRQHGASLLLVSHDERILGAFERVVSIPELARVG